MLTCGFPPALDRPIGALKNRQQLFVLLQCAAVSGSTAAGIGGFRFFLFRLLGTGRVAPQAAGHMGVGGNFVPFDKVARAVAAKYGIRRVFSIGIRLVANSFQHGFGVVAGRIAAGHTAQAARTAGVGGHFPRTAPHFGNRGFAGNDGQAILVFRRAELRAAALQIGHGTANTVLRDFQPEVIPGFQQDRLPPGRRGAQPLPHGAVGCLAKVPALGVLDVGTACRQGDFHIGQRRTGQHAGVAALRQVGQNQPLPVQVQRIGAANAGKLQAAARLAGFQQQMNLRIMAQRFIMAHALHRGRDGLFV